ncbi:hypothetical protein [Haloferula rosea]|uniref:Uncharacterized protein n=1 Tax=Haloferula rosea TaxID=490093 RepID=A0A934VAT5_9BACT|nr:hypothetical protein [Haloferula rosea]MBK1826668.1 hypothetical protein [Haloferula rosea]
MNIERIVHVTDPEVHQEPAKQMTGYETEQSIEQELFEKGIRAAGSEQRMRAEIQDTHEA